jgi:DNA-directed RNA polymerase sigma subunit (sigma70/sigma32)
VTPARRDYQIERAYRAGKSLREVGAQYGITYERVRQILNERGVTLRTTVARMDAGARKTLATPVIVCSSPDR